MARASLYYCVCGYAPLLWWFLHNTAAYYQEEGRAHHSHKGVAHSLHDSYVGSFLRKMKKIHAHRQLVYIYLFVVVVYSLIGV